MKTLSEILATESAYATLPPHEQAIIAAYWAGKSQGWRDASNAARGILAKLPRWRYHRLQATVTEAVVAATARGNDAPEILSWEFELTKEA